MSLVLWKPKHEKQQDLKNRILKNKECVLDVLSEGTKGARTCPHLLGQKCVGSFCEKFMQFFNIDAEGNKKEYWRCSDVQVPLLLIELNQNIRKLTEAINESRNQKSTT